MRIDVQPPGRLRTCDPTTLGAGRCPSAIRLGMPRSAAARTASPSTENMVHSQPRPGWMRRHGRAVASTGRTGGQSRATRRSSASGPRTMGPCPRNGSRLVRSHLAEPPHRGRGTHPFGANRTSDGDPNAEPDSSPRRPRGRFEVRGVQAAQSTQPLRASARGRAESRPRHGRFGRCRREPGARRGPAADHRPSRRPRSHRPRRPGRCAVHRQPPRRVRRSRRPSFGSPDGGHPGPRRGVAPAPVRAADAAGHGRRRHRLLGQPVAEQPLPAAPLGRDVSGSTSWSDRRVVGHGPVRGDGHRLARRRRDRRPDRRSGRHRPRWPRRGGLRDRLHGPAGAGRGRTAALLGARLLPLHPRPTRPGPHHAGAGVLRRRARRGDPALCPRLRRPARSQPGRCRPDRRPRRRLDDRLVPALGRGRGSSRIHRGAAPRRPLRVRLPGDLRVRAERGVPVGGRDRRRCRRCLDRRRLGGHRQRTHLAWPRAPPLSPG